MTKPHEDELQKNRERVKAYHRNVAKDFARRMVTRICLVILFFMVGMLLWVVRSTFSYAAFAMSVIFFLFFLDAWSMRREILERDWVSITPRFSHWRGLQRSSSREPTAERPAE